MLQIYINRSESLMRILLSSEGICIQGMITAGRPDILSYLTF